jgi:hypothetical protein
VGARKSIHLIETHMDNETKKKLGPADYIPDSEYDIQRGEDGKETGRTLKSANPATYILAPLDGFDELDVLAEITRTDDEQMRISGTGARKALASGLKGWRGNVCDRFGEPMEYSRENVGRLSPSTISDLAWEVVMRSQITESERKNS